MNAAIPAVRRVLAVAIALQLAAPAVAQTQPATRPTADERTFLVSPALPDPLAKPRLRTPPTEQIHRNAAALYAQAFVGLPEYSLLNLVGDLYIDNEDDQAFLKAVAEKAPWLDTQLQQTVEAAVRSDHCDWDLPIQEYGVNVLLPTLNVSRAFSNYLRTQARFAALTQTPDVALKLIAANFTLARHMQEGNVPIVSNLVGVGIMASSLESLEHVYRRADAPNLYFDFRSFPVPSANYHAALDVEEMMFAHEFPMLLTSDLSKVTPEQWREAVARANQDRVISDSDPVYPPSDVNQALRYFETYRSLAVRVKRWEKLSYHESLTRLSDLSEEFKKASATEPGNPFLRSGASLWFRFILTNARLDRTIAAFATVEALRAYAAAHDGRLPASLADCTDYPAPVNPATNQPFDYTLRPDGSALLTAPPLVTSYPLRYEIRIRR